MNKKNCKIKKNTTPTKTIEKPILKEKITTPACKCNSNIEFEYAYYITQGGQKRKVVAINGIIDVGCKNWHYWIYQNIQI